MRERERERERERVERETRESERGRQERAREEERRKDKANTSPKLSPDLSFILPFSLVAGALAAPSRRSPRRSSAPPERRLWARRARAPSPTASSPRGATSIRLARSKCARGTTGAPGGLTTRLPGRRPAVWATPRSARRDPQTPVPAKRSIRASRLERAARARPCSRTGLPPRRPARSRRFRARCASTSTSTLVRFFAFLFSFLKIKNRKIKTRLFSTPRILTSFSFSLFSSFSSTSAAQKTAVPA